MNEPNEKVTAKRGRPTKASRGDHVTGKRPSARIPLSGSRKRLHLNEKELDPAFHYKWANDVDDNLRQYIDAGYVHVGADEGLRIGQRAIDNPDGETSSVVSRDVGKGVTTFLMKQPIEFYEEDKGLKEAATNRRDESMRESLNSGHEGTYGEVKFN